MKYLLLCAPLVLAACMGSQPPAKGVGFSGTSVPVAAPVPAAPSYAAPAPMPTQASAAVPRNLSIHANQAMGRSLSRDSVAVPVADRTMQMRVVTVRGQTFAVMGETGIPFSLTVQPNLSAEAQAVAQARTGCFATGKTYTKRYSNGAFPKYAVHLACG